MAMVSLFLLNATLPLAVSLRAQSSAELKSSWKMISPRPGRCSGVGGSGVLVGKDVRVGVGGNHTTVGVTVAVGEGIGVGGREAVGEEDRGRQALTMIHKETIPTRGFL
jgi:hypothetical protein